MQRSQQRPWHTWRAERAQQREERQRQQQEDRRQGLEGNRCEDRASPPRSPQREHRGGSSRRRERESGSRGRVDRRSSRPRRGRVHSGTSREVSGCASAQRGRGRSTRTRSRRRSSKDRGSREQGSRKSRGRKGSASEGPTGNPALGQWIRKHNKHRKKKRKEAREASDLQAAAAIAAVRAAAGYVAESQRRLEEARGQHQQQAQLPAGSWPGSSAESAAAPLQPKRGRELEGIAQGDLYGLAIEAADEAAAWKRERSRIEAVIRKKGWQPPQRSKPNRRARVKGQGERAVQRAAPIRPLRTPEKGPPRKEEESSSSGSYTYSEGEESEEEKKKEEEPPLEEPPPQPRRVAAKASPPVPPPVGRDGLRAAPKGSSRSKTKEAKHQ